MSLKNTLENQISTKCPNGYPSAEHFLIQNNDDIANSMDAPCTHNHKQLLRTWNLPRCTDI